MAEAKKIVLEVGDKELVFNVSLADYNGYINAVKADDKVAPSIRFLRNTVDKSQLDDLNGFIAVGLTMQLTGPVIEAFVPDVEIEVKK